MDHAPFLNYIWTHTNFRKSKTIFFYCVTDEGAKQAIVFVLIKPFQPGLLFVSKAVYYLSEVCYISSLHFGHGQKLRKYTPKLLKFFTVLLLKGQNKHVICPSQGYFSQVYYL